MTAGLQIPAVLPRNRRVVPRIRTSSLQGARPETLTTDVMEVIQHDEGEALGAYPTLLRLANPVDLAVGGAVVELPDDSPEAGSVLATYGWWSEPGSGQPARRR